jgi:WhiB family redox-sensing transcriptional regulator
MRAACRDVPTDTFYPERGDPLGTGPAKRICAGCPVRAECLADALERGDPWGVWGGLSERERRRLKRRGRVA